MLCLVLSLTSALPTQSNAEEKLCFPKTEAQKLLVEVKYGKVTLDQRDNCFAQYSTLRKVNANNEKMVTDLKKDKVDLMGVSDSFRQQLIDRDKMLQDCEESKPSRLTWFGWGAITTLLLGIVGAIAIK